MSEQSSGAERPFAPARMNNEGGHLGLQINRLIGLKSLPAREIDTEDYKKLAFLTDTLSLNPSKLRKMLKDQYPAGFGNSQIDHKTLLTTLSDSFEFTKERQSIRCYNFDTTSLTDNHLADIADAFSSAEQELGDGVWRFRSIMLVPHGHPTLLIPDRQDPSKMLVKNGTVFGNMIILNAGLLTNKGTEPVASPEGERPYVLGANLRNALIHELGHIWQNAFPTAAKQYEEDTRGEEPPSEYAKKRGSQVLGRMYDEDLPETLVAQTAKRTAHLVEVKHRKAIIRAKKATTFGNTERTAIDCHQIDPDILMKQQRKDPKRWLRFGRTK
ncbi:MAG TPA: hypothetical protein VE090_00195 [Methylomirabilota bacterium]|nr:hypothetical protein [Methylomirabilota bacterium]